MNWSDANVVTGENSAFGDFYWLLADSDNQSVVQRSIIERQFIG